MRELLVMRASDDPLLFSIKNQYQFRDVYYFFWQRKLPLLMVKLAALTSSWVDVWIGVVELI